MYLIMSTKSPEGMFLLVSEFFSPWSYLFRESWKFEMSKEEEFNPIKHDVKDGELRCAFNL